MRRTLPVVLSAVAALALVLAATVYGFGSREAQVQTPRPHPVVVSSVEAAPEEVERRFYGITRAAEQAVLSFTSGGRVLARPIEIGQAVHRGDVIARLDPRPYRNTSNAQAAAVAELESRLGQLERDRRRMSHLVEVGAATRHDLEEAETGAAALRSRLEAARSLLAEARRTLGETTLRAPFDGVIAEVGVEPGELVGPGTPVAILAGNSGVEVEVEVPESLAGRLEKGAPARIDLPLARTSSVRGHVRSVGHSAGLSGRLFPVVIDLESSEGRALPGMTAEVILEVPLASDMLAVPVAAIVDPVGSGARVFVVRNHQVEQVPVTVHHLLGDRVTVEGDLEVGAEVVVGGQVGLVEGLQVEVSR